VNELEISTDLWQSLTSSFLLSADKDKNKIEAVDEGPQQGPSGGGLFPEDMLKKERMCRRDDS
jgi:hypothetical protein